MILKFQIWFWGNLEREVAFAADVADGLLEERRPIGSPDLNFDFVFSSQ